MPRKNKRKSATPGPSHRPSPSSNPPHQSHPAQNHSSSAERRDRDRDQGSASGNKSSDRNSAERKPPSSERPRASSPPRNSHNRDVAGPSTLATNMENLTISQQPPSSRKIRPVARPSFGRSGRAVTVESNFFKLTVPKKMRIAQYAICILQFKHRNELDAKKKKQKRERSYPEEEKEWLDTSAVEPIFFNRNVFEAMLHSYGSGFGCQLAYDGRSIAYSPRLVNLKYLGHDFRLRVGREGKPATQEEQANGKVVEVRVRIDHVKNLDLDDVLNENVDSLASIEYLAAIDNALAHSPMDRYVQIGRSFYSPEEARPLGRGRNVLVSAWRGFYQSARLSQLGLVVNLDESFTAFWNRGGRPMMELVRDANDGREISARDGAYALNQVAKKLKLLKLRAVHTHITYKMHGFSDKSADQLTFPDARSGRNISITEYFAQTYNKRLRYGHLPCVKTHPKRDTYLPMEMLVVLENQRVMGLLTPEMTSSMVRTASTKPQDKKRAAMKVVSDLNYSQDKVCKDFGLSVERDLVKVRARILPPPPIEYFKSNPAKPSMGTWRPTGRFLSPATLKTWAIITEGNCLNDQAMGTFLSHFQAAAKKGGLDAHRPVRFNAASGRVPQEMQRIAAQVAKGSLQMILVIKERHDARTYNEIKCKGDIDLGVMTQVCLAKNLHNMRGLAQYCDNVMLKINSKLGGQNFRVGPYRPADGVPNLKFENIPHMILGADVTHPMPGARSASVAALVGSRDREGVQYSAAIRNQPGRQEVIADLGNMFKEVYVHWMNNFANRHHVKHLIMFRDGVSEGQFEEVMAKEVQALREACVSVAAGCRPLITYIIVTKRHHTKFFPMNPRDGDRSGNISPGTVVDRDVTSKEFYDFYVNSHAGIQGTSKPSKYTVLIDENKIAPDELQGFIFRLSHGFVRCNRSVSMVNSAYYAHLLAFRGRAYLRDDMSDTASVASMESAVPPTPLIHDMLARRLYFV